MRVRGTTPPPAPRLQSHVDLEMCNVEKCPTIKKYTDTGNVGKLGYDSSILSRHQLNKFLVTRMVLYHLHETCLTYMFAHLLYFAERY